jgi:hypothetical protein
MSAFTACNSQKIYISSFLSRSPLHGERVIVIDQTVAVVVAVAVAAAAVCHEMSWTT